MTVAPVKRTQVCTVMKCKDELQRVKRELSQ